MQSLVRDIVYAVRGFLAAPAFSLTAIIALGLAIGANTVVFSALDAVLLQPLSYESPDQLAWIWANNRAAGIKDEPLSYPDFDDWRSESKLFEDMVAFAPWAPILKNAGEPERIPGAMVSPNLFKLLGTQASLGRTFSQNEDQAGQTNVAVLGSGLWRRRFGARSDIIGKTITLNESVYQVVGVMPASFQFPDPEIADAPELWAPLPSSFKAMNRRADFLSVVARLNPSASLAEARSELETIAGRLEESYPGTNKGWGVTVVPLYQRFTGDVRQTMVLLAVTVAFLLLIACANLANLLLIRAIARRRDTAMRKALGASRARLVQQFLVESSILALAGGIAGSVLAFVGIRALIAFGPKTIPRLANAGINLRALGFGLAASLLTGLVLGLLPLLQTSHTDLNEELKEGGRSSTAGFAGRRLRGLLLILEVALALTLLTGSMLLIRSFLKLQRVNPGFTPQGLLTLQLILPKQKYSRELEVRSFTERAIENVRSLPDVEDAAAVTTVPLSGNLAVRDFVVEGHPSPPAGQLNDAEFQVISTSFFHTMKIPLLSGRTFTDQDNEDSAPVVVISDAAAKRYWPGEDPIGRRLSVGDGDNSPWLTVVGVVGNIRESELGVPPYPQMYMSFRQNPQWSTALIIKSRSEPERMINEVRTQIASVDPDQPLYHVQTMAQVMTDSLSRQRFNTQLMTLLTAVAFALTIVGIYGVVSYIAAQRGNEIGIRMALGAQKSKILGMMVWQGLRLALIGIVLGVPAALVLTRLMTGLLYGVSPSDPGTFITISLLVGGVAMVASYVPALKAAKTDPATALRHD